MRRGTFITFEGGEGTGKSTQIRRLADVLQSRGIDILTTREPGGSPGAESIRALLVKGETARWDGATEALLLYAARRDHVERTIKPALATGKVVLCDRFADSTTAYQGAGHGLDRAALAGIRAAAIGSFAPDLTLIFDMPVAEGLRRAEARGGVENRYERMGIAFHERLKKEFLDIAATEPARCVVIDAARDMDAVARDVEVAVLKRLPHD
ncbi:MAG: dTMP kinase [Alphaproteobacteria bacterium]|nr:dTMP kinase [Alphaproteobacteria bacterium]